MATLDTRTDDLAIGILGIVLVDVAGAAAAVRDLGSGHDEVCLRRNRLRLKCVLGGSLQICEFDVDTRAPRKPKKMIIPLGADRDEFVQDDFSLGGWSGDGGFQSQKSARQV